MSHHRLAWVTQGWEVEWNGEEKVEAPVLYVVRHVDWKDAGLALSVEKSLKVFVPESDVEKKSALRAGVDGSHRPGHLHALAKPMADLLKDGSSVCLFVPFSGELREGLEELAAVCHAVGRSAQVKVVPVWQERIQFPIYHLPDALNFMGGHRRVRFSEGMALEPEEAIPSRLLEEFLRISSEAYSGRPEFEHHLGLASFRGLRARASERLIVDGFQNDKEMSAGMLLAAGLQLSEWMRREISDKRVGIVLPPGIGGTLVNLACVLCDKVPVNINFTAGKSSCEAVIRKAEIRTVFTAQALVTKLKDFPWTEDRRDLAEVMRGIGKPRILLRWMALQLLPESWLLERYKIPREGGDREAGLLFTSGSSGEPKGVALSHRNILSNVAQCCFALPKDRINSIMGCLPIFHSFGFTVTVWWPLISGPRVVTYPSPLEPQKIISLIERFRVALLVTTPTFLRSYTRRAKPEQLKSLATVVTGAEKLPMPVKEAFEEKFGVPVSEGYGATETSPVAAVNRLDLSRKGSVGPPVYGMAVRVLHPETRDPVDLFEQGLLAYSGANIFEGYLDDKARTDEVFEDGWYVSGDVGRMDADGFLYIEGRLSRFSKIGGEMVPHGTVETKLVQLFAEEEEGVTMAVMGIRDEVKGEALVLLTTLELDVDEMRRRMGDEGLPNLWIPKVVKRVDEIPVLASGKLDLKGCQELAES